LAPPLSEILYATVNECDKRSRSSVSVITLHKEISIVTSY